MSDHERNEQPEEPGMDINLDRARKVRGTIAYWLAVIAVGGLLAALLAQFTGSKLIAFSLAGGMLLYMVIMAAVTSKNLAHSRDDGRLS